MKKVLTIAALATGLMTCLASATATGGDDKDIKKKASIWMLAKTEYAKNLLLGLTEGDFAKIETNAKQLSVVDFFEYLFRTKNVDYRRQIVIFENANQELIRHAKAKNLPGATLAFNQLTASCVQCHQIVRDAKK